MVKITVIMPVYNDEDYLSESIESVCKQTLKDIELICVNDGSTDNSLNVLNHCASEYDFIKVYSKKMKDQALQEIMPSPMQPVNMLHILTQMICSLMKML